MEQTVSRTSRAGWREDEIDQLWEQVRRANESGRPLRSVFEQMGETLGRKPNSVRNYYYMQLRPRDGAAARRAAPFTTFSEGEVRALVKEVLRARAQGQSVRACVMALSGGDHTLMLRYQNKYRAVLKKRPELIEALREELRAEGVECPNPWSAVPRGGEELRRQCAEKARILGDPDVNLLLSGLDALLERALNADPQTRGDRLRVQLDLATLRYDGLSRAAGELLLLCKEYLGRTPDGGDVGFREALAQRVANVENAIHTETPF